MLQLNTVTKIYQGKTESVVALETVTMNVTTGEFVSVQGPSGSGKTTLLLTAGGLLLPDEGFVSIDGNDLYGMAPDERAGFRASTIGFVFQQFHLIHYLTVLENVLVPSLAVHSQDAETRARELLDRLNMTGRLHHVPSELSTGERQRTAMARALLNNPRLLLADEPTGNLDRDNGDIIMVTFNEFAQAGGAVLLVTHDETVSQYAHRSVRLENGRIVG